MIAEMKRRGMEAKSHRSMVQAVERFAVELNEPALAAEFAAARYFHSNFYNGTMDDYEFEVDRPKVHRFVSKMLELVGESDV